MLASEASSPGATRLGIIGFSLAVRITPYQVDDADIACRCTANLARSLALNIVMIRANLFSHRTRMTIFSSDDN